MNPHGTVTGLHIPGTHAADRPNRRPRTLVIADHKPLDEGRNWAGVHITREDPWPKRDQLVLSRDGHDLNGTDAAAAWFDLADISGLGLEQVRARAYAVLSGKIAGPHLSPALNDLTTLAMNRDGDGFELDYDLTGDGRVTLAYKVGQRSVNVSQGERDLPIEASVHDVSESGALLPATYWTAWTANTPHRIIVNGVCAIVSHESATNRAHR